MHQCNTDDKVFIAMLRDERDIKIKLDKLTKGLYEILQVHNNGTVTIMRGSYQESNDENAKLSM